jgi:hypothetical protein
MHTVALLQAVLFLLSFRLRGVAANNEVQILPVYVEPSGQW